MLQQVFPKKILQLNKMTSDLSEDRMPEVRAMAIESTRLAAATGTGRSADEDGGPAEKRRRSIQATNVACNEILVEVVE